MVQRDEVPEEVTDIERWIQDKYTLESTSYTDNLPQGGEHLKQRGYGVQPDGDLVGDMATGQLFSFEQDLAAGETFVSDWYDTDGFNALEVFIESDVTSNFDGIKFQFTSDTQADTPPIDGEETKSYQEFYARQGYKIFKTETNLDGFRLIYENNSDPTNGLRIFVTAKNSLSLDGANYVDQNVLGENQLRVGNDLAGEGLKIGEPTSLFGDMATISRSTVLDVASSFGTSVLRDELLTTGSASITENPSAETGEIEIATGTTAGSELKLRTAEFGRYTPGYSAQAGVGIRVPDVDNFTSGEARWGYFDDEDGFYFGYDGTQPTGNQLFVARRRNGTETQRIYRENWNRQSADDVFDREFDIGDGSIYQIDFSWYGYGIVRFSVVDQTANDLTTISPRQQTVAVHALEVANETSVSDPNLPINVEIDNGASTDDNRLRIGGRQFSVFGEEPDEQRDTSETNEDVAIPNGTWGHVMSWRRGSTGLDANARIGIDGIDFGSDVTIKLALVVDANVTTNNYTLPTLTPIDETLLEVSTDETFNGIGAGTKIWEKSLQVSGQGQAQASIGEVDVGLGLGQNKSLSLIVQGVGGSGTGISTMRMTEDF